MQNKEKSFLPFKRAPILQRLLDIVYCPLEMYLISGSINCYLTMPRPKPLNEEGPINLMILYLHNELHYV